MNRKSLFRNLLLLSTMAEPATGGSFRPAAPPADAPASFRKNEPHWPTEDWRASTPEAQNVDSAKLAAMEEDIRGNKIELHGLLIVRNGYIVHESYYGGRTANTPHELYSCTKSFISTLVGIALDSGLLKGVDLKVKGFFPESSFQNPDPRKDAMTLEDLLTMRSGLDWTEGDPTYQAWTLSRDWVRFVMGLPMAREPGTAFLYCSGGSHVISAILEKVTGGKRAFADERLFGPLGIRPHAWELDPSGMPFGAKGLQLTPREMAKLGYLYLNRGKWDGRRIVSAEWVRAATQKHTATDGDLDYGYQWWIDSEHNAYTATGRYGQVIFVAPEKNMVIVITAGEEDHTETFRLIDQHILPAARN
jgi:CubicO group peptidase (beta-lactamase class C family)